MYSFVPVLLSIGLIRLGFGLTIPVEPNNVQTKVTLNDILPYPHSNYGSLPPSCLHNIDRSLGKLEDCTKAGPSIINNPKEKPKKNKRQNNSQPLTVSAQIAALQAQLDGIYTQIANDTDQIVQMSNIIDDLYLQLRYTLSDTERRDIENRIVVFQNARQTLQDERTRLTALTRALALQIDQLNSEQLPAYSPPSPNLPPYNPHSPGTRRNRRMVHSGRKLVRKIAATVKTPGI